MIPTATITWEVGNAESVATARRLYELLMVAGYHALDANGHPLPAWNATLGSIKVGFGKWIDPDAALPEKMEVTWSPTKPAEVKRAASIFHHLVGKGWVPLNEDSHPVREFDARSAYFMVIKRQHTTEEENMGDKTVTWSPDDKAECDRAEAEFAVLEAAGFNLLINGKGVTKFDRKAGSFLATKAPVTSKAGPAETKEDKAQDAANASAAKPKPKAKAKAKAKPAAQQPDENQAASQADDKETDANV